MNNVQDICASERVALESFVVIFMKRTSKALVNTLMYSECSVASRTSRFVFGTNCRQFRAKSGDRRTQQKFRSASRHWRCDVISSGGIVRKIMAASIERSLTWRQVRPTCATGRVSRRRDIEKQENVFFCWYVAILCLISVSLSFENSVILWNFKTKKFHYFFSALMQDNVRYWHWHFLTATKYREFEGKFLPWNRWDILQQLNIRGQSNDTMQS